jgi:uncharacterized protein YecE (DUF72 family)
MKRGDGEPQTVTDGGTLLARIVATMLKIGLCGWTIAAQEYFRRFRVLEVQQTFYDPPAERTLVRWRESAPPGFEFTLKAWQLITHEGTSSTYRRLRRPLSQRDRADAGSFRESAVVDAGWVETLRCARVLRATSVLFQCPASFRPTEENTARMRGFFRRTERHGLRFLWEPRGAWPADLVRGLCEELQLVHVVDPFVSQTVTPERIYFRLHGVGGSRHVYTDAELAHVASLVREADGAYVMFNNLPRVGDAQRFEALLERNEER